MKTNRKTKVCSILNILLMFTCLSIYGQDMTGQKAGSSDIVLGAYYFDGWTGTTFHITDKLKSQYPVREPIWGWATSTQPIVDAQISKAAEAGLGFFAFDWYFKDGTDNYPLNHALSLYRSSPNKDRLQFCLMVANHNPYYIQPDNWGDVSQIWLKLFKDKQYLKVDGKPLLIFFEVSSLVDKFGSTEAVKKAFAQLKEASIKAGLKGVSIAACVYNNAANLHQAEACGFDVLTGYNYHSDGLAKDREVTPIDSMSTAEVRVWNGIKTKSHLPYMPCITLNWDPRPWRADTVKVPRFSGYSMSSVYHAVHAARKWISENTQRTPREKIAVMYAWNENGEGGWLTPSKIAGDSLLSGVKKSLSFSLKANGQTNNIRDVRNVLILGNSITRHAPSPGLGWFGDWGMAASEKEKDYVHDLIRRFKEVNPSVHFHIKTIVDFERSYWNYDFSALDSLAMIKPDLIILHIGENVPSKKLGEKPFGPYYGKLLHFFISGNTDVKIICTSSFWSWEQQQKISDIIEREAHKENCFFVRIDQLSSDSSAMAIGKFKNHGVAIHPSDAGMKAMADLIWQKISDVYIK
ncbi:glycoside hydrolase family 99-like domain-containing protein [Compostibacter hankyongensis]